MSQLSTARKALARELPGCPEGLIEFYAGLVLIMGDDVTMQDVHLAWALWTVRYNPSHHCLVPFDHLPDYEQDKDQLYVDAIRKVAADMTDVPRETKEEA